MTKLKTIFDMSAEDIKDLILVRRRAGLPELTEGTITESSPLLMKLVELLMYYKKAYQKGGEKLAKKALLDKGLDAGTVEKLAGIFREEF